MLDGQSEVEDVYFAGCYDPCPWSVLLIYFFQQRSYEIFVRWNGIFFISVIIITIIVSVPGEEEGITPF